MKETFVIIGVVLAFAGNLPYLRDILKGKVKPHPYTWLVGSIVSCTVFFGMLAKGAGIGALPVAASEIFTVIIFLVSLKFGFKGTTNSDRVFLFLALAGLLPWILTHDPTISVVIAVGIDLASLAPTFRKTYIRPSTEAPVLYASNIARHICSLLSLQTYNIATTLHSIVMIFSNTGMIALIYRPRNKRK